MDSYAFSPHTWMLTNYDCCALWASDSGPLKDALSLTPFYLRVGAALLCLAEPQQTLVVTSSALSLAARLASATGSCTQRKPLPYPSQGAGNVLDLKDWQVPLGRRFRWAWLCNRHASKDGSMHMRVLLA